MTDEIDKMAREIADKITKEHEATTGTRCYFGRINLAI